MLAVSPSMASFRPNAFGAELIRLRGDVHLSQRALARLAGVSNTAISGLESGVAPPPHPSMLSRLARGLATNGSQKVDERRAEAVVPLGHDGDDIACWTRRWQDGHIETWRAIGLAGNALVTAWATGALSPDCRYADLLFRELARLT